MKALCIKQTSQPSISADHRADKPHADKQSASKKKRVDDLLNHSYLWRATHSQAVNSPDNQQSIISSGFKQLDKQLACGGWPLGQFIECLLPTQNIKKIIKQSNKQSSDSLTQAQGLLHIFAPAIRQASKSSLPVLLIAPPYTPYLPGWFDQPIDQSLSPVWILETQNPPQNIKQHLWATEQALKSNACSIVISWLDQQRLPVSALRKLQLAARRSQSLFIGIRSHNEQSSASPAPLRLLVQPVEQTNTYNQASQTDLQVDILKQPGSWGGQRVTLSWHKGLQQKALPVQDWPVYIPPHLQNHTSESHQRSVSHTEKPLQKMPLQ